MPPKILAIGQLPPPVSGFSLITERYVALMREGHDVEVCNIAADPGASGMGKASSRIRRTLGACFALLRGVMRKERLCYVACEGNWGLVYTMVVVVVARLSGWPTVLHHHSFRYVDRHDRLMNLLLTVAGEVHHVFLCGLMRERFEATYGRVVSGSIVSNAAFVEVAALDALPPVEGPLVLGHLSNLTREKGLHTFLALLRAGLAAGLDLRGILAGPVGSQADRAAVEAAVAEFDGRLDYRGAVYGEAKEKFYRDAEVFVFPTRYVNEAQPTVLFEAQAAGLAILSHDRGCIASQVAEDGLVVARDADFVPPALDWLRTHLSEPEARTTIRRRIAAGFMATRSQARDGAQVPLIGSSQR